MDGATIQRAGVISWGLGIGLAFAGHAVPAAGSWGLLYWNALGVLMLLAAVVVLGLAVTKLIGDAVSPEWIDRWWDLTR